ncbi:unnamed protein product, partial [Oppiella nova]
ARRVQPSDPKSTLELCTSLSNLFFQTYNNDIFHMQPNTYDSVFKLWSHIRTSVTTYRYNHLTVR